MKLRVLRWGEYLEPLEGVQVCQILDFSSVLLISDFWPPV